MMIFKRRLRWGLAIGLTASVTLDTLLQLVWKSAVLETPADASPLVTLGGIFTNPLFIGMIAIMTLQFFNWLTVLGQADLSYAKPINAVSYASVPLFSLAVLDEALDIVKLAGAALVIAGVWFVSQSSSQTQEVSERL
jgi:drug/metabolite transporter (DMT)-like permease